MTNYVNVNLASERFEGLAPVALTGAAKTEFIRWCESNGVSNPPDPWMQIHCFQDDWSSYVSVRTEAGRTIVYWLSCEDLIFA